MLQDEIVVMNGGKCIMQPEQGEAEGGRNLMEIYMEIRV